MENKKDVLNPVSLLNNVANALSRLTVQGRDNCYIVVACLNDIDRLRDYFRANPANVDKLKPLPPLSRVAREPEPETGEKK